MDLDEGLSDAQRTERMLRREQVNLKMLIRTAQKVCRTGCVDRGGVAVCRGVLAVVVSPHGVVVSCVGTVSCGVDGDVTPWCVAAQCVVCCRTATLICFHSRW